MTSAYTGNSYSTSSILSLLLGGHYYLGCSSPVNKPSPPAERPKKPRISSKNCMMNCNI